MGEAGPFNDLIFKVKLNGTAFFVHEYFEKVEDVFSKDLACILRNTAEDIGMSHNFDTMLHSSFAKLG